MATQNGYEEVVKALLKYLNIDVNTPNQDEGGVDKVEKSKEKRHNYKKGR